MKKIVSSLVYSLSIIVTCILFVMQPAFAAQGINRQINFQGKVVLKTDGTNVNSGTTNYDMVFKLYDAPTGGNLLWTESWTGGNQVPVTDGLFRVALGSVNPFVSSVDWNNPNLYLDISFNGDTMTSRIQLTATPYAFNAEKLDGVVATQSASGFNLSGGTSTLSTISLTTSGNTLSIQPGNPGSLTLQSNGANGLTLDTGGSAAITIGLSATAINMNAPVLMASNKNLTFDVGNGTTNVTIKAGTGGTTTGLLVKIDTIANQVVTSSVTDTNNAVGIAVTSVSSGANAQIAISGVAVAVADNAVSVGDYIGIGTTTAGRAKSVGSVYPSSANTQVIGRALSSASVGSSFNVLLSGFDTSVGAGGSGTRLDQIAAATTGVAGNNNGDNGIVWDWALTSPTKTAFTFGETTAATGGNQNIVGVNTLANSTATALSVTNAGAADAVEIANGNASGTNTNGLLINQTGTGTLTNGINVTNTSGNIINGLTFTGTYTNLINATNFSVANSGAVTTNNGITVNATTGDNVKSTTGSSNSTDFSLAGSTLTNVTSASNQITINDGTVPNSGQGTMATSTVVSAAIIGAGGQVIMRDDGQYVIIHGNSSATGSIWDGSSNTMTSMTVATGATLPGAGAIALRRPDRRYLLVHGNGSAGLTSLFDPYNIQAVAAGPAICGGGAATTGTNAFLRDDGKYVILCGGLTAWGVYDPTANTYTGGTAVASAFGAGAHAIHRDDGTFIIFRGANTTTHYLYNPYTSATGTMTLNPITTNAPTINTGAFSIRRLDGKFVVLGGTAQKSTIYDPTPVNGTNSGAGSFTSQNGGVAAAGWGPSITLGDGATALWREDKKYLIVDGTGTTTEIYDPSQTGSTQFTNGPALNAAVAAGFHTFLRPDGKYQLMRGGATTTTDTYDMGFVLGGDGTGTQLASYETECMTAPNLNLTSTLNWTTNAEGTLNFQVKTGAGSCSGSYKDILNSGDMIRPTAGDNMVQIKVFFKRGFPQLADQDWGIRRSGMTIYRRINADPTLYDVVVANSAVLHRSQFDLGESSDPSGPVSLNLVNNPTGGLALAASAGPLGFGTTINVTNPQVYNGAFANFSSLATAGGKGTVILKRPDSKFIVIPGGAASPNSMVYDQDLGTFINNSANPAVAPGAGALSFKRPDGKFFIVMGNSTTTTSIYDPIANTFTAGPALIATAGEGALAIALPTGRVMIMHGNNVATSSIYDPVNNVIYQGPSASAALNPGSVAIPRPDGSYLVALGTVAGCASLTTTTNSFNPYTMTFTSAGSPAVTTGQGPGGFAFQRQDGQWVIVHGGATITTCAGINSTNIYNPITNQMVVGPTLSAVAASGAHAIPRPDGTWLIIHGGGLGSTSIFQEKTGAFTANGLAGIGQFIAGPSLANSAVVNSGAISFQRDDGRFVTFIGSAATSNGMQTYDGGWVQTGTYKSEQINVPNLDTTSTLSWNASPQMGVTAEVATATTQAGLAAASKRDIGSSGGLINPGTSETWIQINFNFKRSFPSYPGITSDVFFNPGSAMNFSQRNILTPTLNSFDVNKDSNLLNLQADGISYLRVTSKGDIYTSSNGSINSGGADLAERYTSATVLEKGDVVAIDPTNNHGVKQTTYQYQPNVLGVVSTEPGFVAGGYTQDSYPIALVGRVPVHVSTENGAIHTGDFLTASSVSGYAMKAKKAGRVIGTALENLDDTSLVDCPQNLIFLPNRKCGTVMMFVNLTDYAGQSLEDTMDSQNVSGLDENIASTSANTDQPEAASLSMLPQKENAVLSFLENLHRQESSLGTYQSSLVTDSLAATNEVISPKIITDLLYAKTIKADHIEGLEILTNQISALTSTVATLSAKTGEPFATNSAITTSIQPTQTVSSNGHLSISGLSVDGSATVAADLRVKGSGLIEGIFHVVDTLTTNNIIINSLADFFGNVFFHKDITISGHTTVGMDTTGTTVIKKDTDSITVAYKKEYLSVPNVTISMVIVTPGQEHKILDGDYTYAVANSSTKGFSIILNKMASQDITFSWVAFGIDTSGGSTELQETISISPPQTTTPSFPQATMPVGSTSAK